MGEKRIAYMVLAGNQKGLSRIRWEVIGTDLGEIGWGGMHWIDLAQNRDKWRAFVNTVMNLRLP
jgi:hypothetical protein